MEIEGYTTAELAALSDEEREAIESADAEERKALNAIVGDNDDGDEGGGESGDEVGEGNATKGAEAEAEGVEAEGAEAEGAEKVAEAEAEGDDRFVPKYHADPVEDYEGKVSALDQQFEDGDITLQEYNAQRDALMRANLKAEIAAEQQEQTEAQIWAREVSDFFDDHPEYKSENSKLRNFAFDAAVKEVAGDPANADKSYKWFLREADARVKKEFGVKADEAGEKPDAKPAGKPIAKRGSDVSGAPVTLAHVPQAGGNDAGGSEFDYIDNLNGIEHERALAKLSPEARDRYLAS